MSLVFKILYAAHANGTHHKLALDSLNYLECENAEGWRDFFLSQIEGFVRGSKEPDKVFKDFKNHVYHVSDKGWGGAPDKVREWYDKTVEALKVGAFEDAAYCAGVLSHYYTDPVQPFHTAQSEAENIIHRAAEWSISKSYDELWEEAKPKVLGSRAEVRKGARFAEDMTKAGATFSHQYYEKLIAHYNFDVGVVTPEEGYSPAGRDILKTLIAYAVSNYAQLLSRAIEQSGADAPEANLTADAVVASLKIPVRWVTNKMADAQERRVVEAMYDELQETGTVDKNLSEDDRAIRDMHAADFPKKTGRGRSTRKKTTTKATKPRSRTVADKTVRDKPQRLEERLGVVSPAETAETLNMTPKATGANEKSEATGEQRQPERVLPVAAGLLAEGAEKELAESRAAYVEEPPKRERITQTRKTTGGTRGTDPGQIYLKASDSVEDAPSIGRKTAARLGKAGIHSVSDLLSVDAAEAAELVEARHITASVIEEWQDQARLVCSIPNLRGTYAKIFTGAGYRDAASIAKADVHVLKDELSSYIETSEGTHALGGMKEPTVAMIEGWIAGAEAAVQERAA